MWPASVTSEVIIPSDSALIFSSISSSLVDTLTTTFFWPSWYQLRYQAGFFFLAAMAQLTAAWATWAAIFPEESLRSLRTAMTILYSILHPGWITSDARLNNFADVPPIMFEVLSRDGLARLGRISTPHGEVRTPTLLPVINPRSITVEPSEMAGMGFDALITNSYIIRKHDGLRERALSEGVHSLLDFDGTVMTDSGTFQSHMYGDVNVTNREIVSFQRDIDSDIGTVLDIFAEPHWSRDAIQEAVGVTLDRTREALDARGEMLLAGVVQGGLFPDLREACSRDMWELPIDVHPIGGVVPLMESYRFSDLVDVVISSKKGLRPSRPVHLFGAGHPMLFALATLMGCDMFDSASYAKFARDERLMFVEGTYHLEHMSSLSCCCPACKDQSLESVLEMGPQERRGLIARHNLWVSLEEIHRVRRAIAEGDLWELVERRCRCHPSLLSALRRLGEHVDFLERFEPLSRDTALFYTGPETLSRPVMRRYERRVFERFTLGQGKSLVTLEEGNKPYGRHLDWIPSPKEADAIVPSPFGPVPLPLDEVYPISQSLFPEIGDMETRERKERLMRRVRDLYRREGAGAESTQEEMDLARVTAVIDYQFGKGMSRVLMDGEISLVRSRSTGKIRTVWVDGEHILSMRASDGLFTLKVGGARRLMSSGAWRVTVHGDAVPFNREGRNVFCRFVEGCDPQVVPRDEVLVVDPEDNLVALGRALLTREEMLASDRGMAVKVREGVSP